jgi:hypothetical protein
VVRGHGEGVAKPALKRVTENAEKARKKESRL